MTPTDSAAPPVDERNAGADWHYGTHVEQAPGTAPQNMSTVDLERSPGLEQDQERETAGSDRHDVRRDRNRDTDGRSGDGSDAGQRQARKEQGADDRHQNGKHDEATKGKDEPPPPPPSKWVFIVAGLVVLGLLAWGAYGHWRRNSDAANTQQAMGDRVTEVRTTEAKRDDKAIDLTLPGQTEAFETANLYPRATGYVTSRRVDIGSRVTKGELLLHITAPDLDQQLAQAEAQVGQVKAAESQAQAQVTQAEANLNLAKVTLARTAQLTQQGYETLQNRDNQTANQSAQQATLDTAKAGVKVAAANTQAQMATVDRLKALTGFENVTAPFDGIVTIRNVDVGDLVNADSSTASPMFSLARDDIIRTTVQVPQNDAIGVRDGLPAKVEVPQLPTQVFTGTVTRSSGALLSSARTLDTEVDIPNPDGRLRAGLFAYITIEIPRDHPEVIVPAESLIFNQHGMQVAVVENDTIKLHQIKIKRDFGTTVSIAEGLNGGEQIVLSPPAILKDGARVKAQRAEDQRPEGSDQPDKSKDQDSNKNKGSGQPDAKKNDAGSASQG